MTTVQSLYNAKFGVFFWFGLIMSQSTSFQSCQDGSSWVEPVLSSE